MEDGSGKFTRVVCQMDASIWTSGLQGLELHTLQLTSSHGRGERFGQNSGSLGSSRKCWS